MRIVIALGGNALLHRGEHLDADSQIRHVAELGPVLRAIAAEHEVLITHGNGEQVGMLAEQSEADAALQEAYPLDALGAQTQGLLGYWLVRELDRDSGVKPAVAIVTRVLVEPADVVSATSSKFVGPLYSEAEARRLSSERGWQLSLDRVWWRRTVASPDPVGILELPAIAELLAGGSTVVCCGGGGIPVTRDDEGVLHGVAAVVDKDLTAALLARTLRADALLLLTDVDAVYSGFGTERGAPIRHAEAEELRKEEFPAGSMALKVRAGCEFALAGTGFAAIGAAPQALDILAGRAGTRIYSTKNRSEKERAQTDAAWAFSG